MRRDLAGRSRRVVIVVALSVASFGACSGPPEVVPNRALINNGTLHTGDPAIVLLVHREPGMGDSYCTGTVIAPTVVLTAAHCVSFSSNHRINTFQNRSQYYWVNFTNEDSDPSPIRVRAVRRYPGFPGGLKDVGLIQLESPTSVTPIAVNRATPITEAHIGRLVRFVGFGADVPALTGSGIKRMTTMALDRVFEHQIEYVPGPGSICPGDSGGPGLLDLGLGEVVVSVNSGGACGGQASGVRLDTLIQEFLDPAIASLAPSCGDNICTGTVGENGTTCPADCCDATTPADARFLNVGDYVCRDLGGGLAWQRRQQVDFAQGTCTPPTCRVLGAECGSIDYSEPFPGTRPPCTGTLNCGGCPGTLTCGGGGVANKCGSPSVEPMFPPDSCPIDGTEAVFVNASAGVPSQIGTGDSFVATYRISNCSGSTWRAATALDAPTGVKLGSEAPTDNAIWGASRVLLPDDVPHGYLVNVRVAARAPVAPGTHTFSWGILDEGVRRIRGSSRPVDVAVRCATTSCSAHGLNCGPAPECPTISCGTCAGAGETCGGAGTPGRCGAPVPPPMDASVPVADAEAPLDATVIIDAAVSPDVSVSTPDTSVSLPDVAVLAEASLSRDASTTVPDVWTPGDVGRTSPDAATLGDARVNLADASVAIDSSGAPRDAALDARSETPNALVGGCGIVSSRSSMLDAWWIVALLLFVASARSARARPAH